MAAAKPSKQGVERLAQETLGIEKMLDLVKEKASSQLPERGDFWCL
jgi:hypothetical protein